MVHPATDGSHAHHLDESILNFLACTTYTTDKSKQHVLAQWGPSDGMRADGVPVCVLTHEMIDEIVAAYGHVAGLAKRAGFEMLMIHGGHGWLINQFLSPLFNHRDEHGGSLENRRRFAIRVLTVVREAVGPFFPIEFLRPEWATLQIGPRAPSRRDKSLEWYATLLAEGWHIPHSGSGCPLKALYLMLDTMTSGNTDSARGAQR